MKIALFGGSFDPFHSDHLKMIETVKNKNIVDEVWIIPTNQNPFKTRKLSALEDRLAMISLGVAHLKYVHVNLIELNNSTPSTTYDTVKTLQDKFPEYQFYFMIGSDLLKSLGQWNNIDELLKLQTFIIFQRDEIIDNTLVTKYQAISISVDNNHKLSSTLIRQGELLHLQIPSINNYIINNLLYLSERLEEKMEELRFIHSINVGQTAKALAIHYNLNSQQALIAGTFHDVTKRWTIEKQRNYLEKYSPEFLSEPWQTWHAYTGYLHLKYDLLYQDEDILNAVKWHTVGREAMTKLEMIVFVADKISAERDYLNIEYYRNLAQENLQKAYQELLIMQYEIAKKKNGINNLGQNLLTSYQYWKNQAKWT